MSLKKGMTVLRSSVIDRTFDQFQQEVLAACMPVLANFWAPWCAPCRLMEPLLNQVQSEYSPHLKLVRINADENLKLASTYRIRTLPTLILFQEGKALHRVEWLPDRTRLQQTLTDILSHCFSRV